MIEKFGKFTLSKKAFAGIFVVCFFVGATFMAWKDEYHRAENATRQLEALTTPRLGGSFTLKAVAPDITNNQDSIISIVASIENTGAPSIAKNFSISVKTARKAVNVIIAPHMKGGMNLFDETGERGFRLEDADFLALKVGEHPIPNNGAAQGFLIGIAKNITKDELLDGTGEVELGFDDIRGGHYSIKGPFLPVTPIIYVGQPKQNKK